MNTEKKPLDHIVDLLIIGDYDNQNVSKISTLMQSKGLTAEVMDPTSQSLVHVKSTHEGELFLEIDNKRIDGARVIWHPSKFTKQEKVESEPSVYDFPIIDWWTKFCTKICFKLPGHHINVTYNNAADWKDVTATVVARKLGFLIPTAQLSFVQPFSLQQDDAQAASTPAPSAPTNWVQDIIDPASANQEEQDDPTKSSEPRLEIFMADPKLGIAPTAPKQHIRIIQIGMQSHIFHPQGPATATATPQNGQAAQPTSLTQEVQTQLQQLLIAMNLDYATIDLIEDVEGNLWFLKCTPELNTDCLQDTDIERVANYLADYFSTLVKVH